MRRPMMWSLLLLPACGARISDAPGDLAGPDDAGATSVDAPPGAPSDGPIALGKWSAPVAIPQVAGAALEEDDATLSASGLEMIFSVDSATGKDLFYTSRASAADPWAISKKLAFNNAAQSDETPRLSIDDKTLYFASGRGGKGLDIYMVTRSAAGASDWGTPALVAGVSTATPDKWYMPCGTRYVDVQNAAAGDSDLYEGPLGGAATPIAELNSSGNETGTFLSKDCLTIYFASRPPPSTRTLIYMSTRDAVGARWKAPTAVADFAISGTDNQEDPWMSDDKRTFVFASNAAGTKDIYISTR